WWRRVTSRWRRLAAVLLLRERSARHRHLVAARVHALHVRRVVPLLLGQPRLFTSRRTDGGAAEKAGARTDRGTRRRIARRGTDRGTRCGAEHRAADRTRDRTLIGRAIGRLTGVAHRPIAADGVVVVELVEALAASRQRGDVRTR